MLRRINFLWALPISALLCACTTTAPLDRFNSTTLPAIAEERANARVDALRASARSGQWNPELLGFLGSLISTSPAIGSVIGFKTAEFVNRHIDDQAERLDAIRKPLKEELTAIFTRRAHVVGDAVAVCVEGTDRRYQWQNDQFRRIEDGPGPCESTKLHTLEKGESN